MALDLVLLLQRQLGPGLRGRLGLVGWCLGVLLPDRGDELLDPHVDLIAIATGNALSIEQTLEGVGRLQARIFLHRLFVGLLLVAPLPPVLLEGGV
jgi:hypothetical protein